MNKEQIALANEEILKEIRGMMPGAEGVMMYYVLTISDKRRAYYADLFEEVGIIMVDDIVCDYHQSKK